MRILMTADTIGGVWTYALELAQALLGRGAEVALATMGAPLSLSQRRQAAELDNLTLHESDYRLEWMNEPWEDVRAAGRWLLDIEQAFRPDVVHLNGYAHGRLPFAAPKLVVGHSCVLSWWEAVRGEPAPSEWNQYRREITAGLRQADLVAAPSRAMLETLNRHYGPFRSSRVIYNGRSRQQYTTPDEKEELILAAGRLWDEAKNVAALETVVPRLPWPVYVAGDDRHPDGHRVRTRGLTTLGRIDQKSMAGWQRRAAVLASPARYEPFGLAVLEAALSRCALVLGDIPSLREIWADAALYVPADDVDALEAALMTLIRDPALRNEMAGRAHRRSSRYSTAAMVDQYMRAYQRLLERADPVLAHDELPVDLPAAAALEG